MINIRRVPQEGRIFLVQNRVACAVNNVSAQYRRFEFLNQTDWQSRGWTADIVACVNRLAKHEFTLNDMYAFEEELGRLHPQNFHLRDKIRQQLQILRDHRIVSFVGRGVYKLG